MDGRREAQHMAEHAAHREAFAEAVREKKRKEKEKKDFLNMLDMMRMYDSDRLREIVSEMVVLFQINVRDVSKIMEGLGNIVFEMQNKWCSFDMMLSDDSSARLVTLFFKRIADNERKKEHLNSISAKFVTPIRKEQNKDSIYQGNWQDFFDKLSSSARVVIITEYIGSGGNLQMITKELQTRQVPFEIVVFGVTGGKNDYKSKGFFDDVGAIDDLMHVGLEHDTWDRVSLLAFYRNKSSLVERSDDGTSIHPQVDNDERTRGIATRKYLKKLADFMSEVVDVMEEQYLFDD